MKCNLVPSVLTYISTIHCKNDQEWNSFLNTYNKLTTKLDALTVDKAVNNQSCTKNNSLESSLRLPTIDLPKFSGNFYDWCPFYETFTGLIHNNKDLLSIQTFHF